MSLNDLYIYEKELYDSIPQDRSWSWYPGREKFFNGGKLVESASLDLIKMIAAKNISGLDWINEIDLDSNHILGEIIKWYHCNGQKAYYLDVFGPGHFGSFGENLPDMSIVVNASDIQMPKYHQQFKDLNVTTVDTNCHIPREAKVAIKAAMQNSGIPQFNIITETAGGPFFRFYDDTIKSEFLFEAWANYGLMYAQAYQWLSSNYGLMVTQMPEISNKGHYSNSYFINSFVASLIEQGVLVKKSGLALVTIKIPDAPRSIRLPRLIEG